MSWLVSAVYLLAFALLVVTGNLWCLAAAGIVLFAAIASAAFVLARQEASENPSDDGACELGESFRGFQGASDE